MELQWSLILFTTLAAWSAGLLGAQSIAALKGEESKAQLASVITAFVLLVASGIAVFTHLQHWERIFNGFGNITSGITQELIAIVLMIVIMVIFFIQARKNDGKVAKWVAIVALVIAVALVFVMAHSYVMASRPAWNTFTWILAVYATALALGPATFAFIAELADKEGSHKTTGMVALIGAAAAAVFSIIYLIAMTGIADQFVTLDYYFDVTHPTKGLVDLAAILSVFTGDNAGLVWGGIIVVGSLLPLGAAVLGKLKGNWKIWGPVAVVCALVGAICIRVLFYNLGYLFFMFF